MTRLAAESPNLHSAQLATLGGTLTSAEQQVAIGRAAMFAAGRLLGVPEPFLIVAVEAGEAAFLSAARPHIVARVVEVGEGITIEGR